MARSSDPEVIRQRLAERATEMAALAARRAAIAAEDAKRAAEVAARRGGSG